MPAFTSFLDLYLPGGGSLGIGGDDEQLDIDRINQNMQKIDVWADGVETDRIRLKNQLYQFYGLAGSIGTVTGMKFGDTYQETDAGKRKWEYDGTNWITSEGGLYLIRPTSVVGTGATLDNAGHVALAASSGNIDLLGIFSARFDRYLVDIEIDNAVGDNGPNFQFISSGAPIVTGYNGTFTEQAVGIGPTKTDASGAASFSIGRYATNGGVISLEVFRPLKVVGTKNFLVRSQDSSGYHRVGGGYLASAAVLEGVRLVLGGAGAAITVGKIKVYGFR